MGTSYLLELGVWGWFVIAILLFLMELTLPGFFLIWFGVAAMIVGLIVLFIPMAWPFQLLLLCVITPVLLLTTRLYQKKLMPDDVTGLGNRGSRYIGETYLLEEDMLNGRGRIRIGDSSWAVQANEDLAKATKVRVTGVSGNTLLVERA